MTRKNDRKNSHHEYLSEVEKSLKNHRPVEHFLPIFLSFFWSFFWPKIVNIEQNEVFNFAQNCNIKKIDLTGRKI